MIFNLKHPKKKYLYAITGGKFLGELFVYIKKHKENYSFLSLPDMKIVDVPYEKFEFGIENKIIETVKKLPSYVYKVCIKQYNKNK